MKYVTGNALTRKEADAMLHELVHEYDADSWFGRYIIEDRFSGALVGMAKLDSYGSATEIGYRILEEYWGKGVATEVAVALIHFSIQKFNSPSVVAFVNVENTASIRVLEKAGMVYMERIEDPDEIKFKFSYTPQTNQTMKKVLYIILGLIALVLIAALIMPKEYAVEREIVINKPKAEVLTTWNLFRTRLTGVYGHGWIRK